MPKSTLPSYDTGDVTSYAPRTGVDYNRAIEALEKDGVLPMYEASYTDIYASDCIHPERAYGWSKATCDLFLSFMAQEGVDAFRMQA